MLYFKVTTLIVSITPVQRPTHFPVRLVVQYKNSEKAMTRAHSEEKPKS